MIKKKDIIEFLKHSNYIERERSKEAYEDALKAWEYIMTLDVLSYDNVMEIHRILMQRLNPRIAGQKRDVSVRVGYKICPNPGSVRRMLFTWLYEIANADTEEKIKQSHIEFENIHPFEDGNGRVGRIIYNWQRLKVGLSLHIIHEGDEQWEYYQWFNDL